MPNSVTLPVIGGQLPVGFCPPNEQARLNGYVSVMSVTLAGINGIIVSQTKPVDTTQTWLQIDSLGRPVRIYQFAAGSWLSLHPQVPGAIMLWDGSLPDFTVFDGGDPNAIGPSSGPMWEEVTAARARSPIHPGTLPSGTVISPTTTGGEEMHTLTIPEIPAHAHTLHFGLNQSVPDGGSSSDGPFETKGPGDNVEIMDNTGGGLGHNTMHPYYGVYLLRRTARLFYAVN